ncbi:hypothetical protein ACO22_03574 [Paracoccidioides brasiliensis]|uniref:Uncharacterized protein n=1 Tax=Paracoccidioides brasiliensis TaxID=121759 RepID=A0A1D2JFM3_PARBR|nr:hypothetical protein ACO22_03574 [Paracoccidioides brasiliensis]
MIISSMERAGSVLRPWFASCFSCIWRRDDEQAHQHHRPTQDLGVEREMKICHDQPHLVPPMKLVLYGELPSPDGTRTSTISQWIAEGRSLALKATDRASLSSRKKSSKRVSLKPTISEPSDFRRVNGMRSRLEPFRPLELSIYQPGNRLSDLPEFEAFDIPTPDKLEILPSKPLPKVLLPTETFFVPESSMLPFKVPRKPVGSTKNLSLSIGSRIEAYDRRPTLQSSILDPAPRSAAHHVHSNRTPQHNRTTSDPMSFYQKPSIDLTNEAQLTPLSDLNSSHHLNLSSDPKFPRSQKVTQWLFPKPPAHHPNATTQNAWVPFPTRPQPTSHSTSHSRTLSNSTISSATMSTMAGTGRTPSLSSAITAATVPAPPSILGTLDKEFESMVPTTSHMANSNNKASVSRFEELCPTVYEADYHHCQPHLFQNDIAPENFRFAF